MTDGSLLPMQFLSRKFSTEKMTSKVYDHAFMFVWKSQLSLLEVMKFHCYSELFFMNMENSRSN